VIDAGRLTGELIDDISSRILDTDKRQFTYGKGPTSTLSLYLGPVRTIIINVTMEKMEKAIFKVIGMYCSSCKPIVEKQLKNKQGVKKIGIDYMTDSVIVEFDPSLISKQEIKNKLERSGYKFVRMAR
jgi:copper chaperone